MSDNKTIKFVIDGNLRKIIVPTNGAVFGIVGDKEVNRATFEMDRWYNGIDMSGFIARVNYVNANGDANYYEPDDFTGIGDKVVFSWLLDHSVTAYSGDVKFSVKFYKKENSKIIKTFGTRISSGKVLDGLDVEKQVTPEEQQALLEKIEAQIKEDIAGDIKEEIKGEINTEIQENINNEVKKSVDKYIAEKGIDAAEIPDNVVLYEEVDGEEPVLDIENVIEQKIKENLSLDADEEYMYLMYADFQLGKVAIGSGVSIVRCTGITINEADMSIDIDDSASHTLTATVTPVDCTQPVKWFSSNTSVVTVSSDGEITVVGEGSSTITARCGNYNDTINIKVKNNKIVINVGKGCSWLLSGSGWPTLSAHQGRGYSYRGNGEGIGGDDSNYKYGVLLENGTPVKINLDPSKAPNCFYGVQVFDADTNTRIVDTGWKAAGTEYNYAPGKDNLYIYINFKSGSAGTETVTDEIAAKLKEALSIKTEVA